MTAGHRGLTPGARATASRPFIASAAVLAAAMGFGRFAYTPLIVVMARDAGLTGALAGILASLNLAGYLVGALIATLPAVRKRRYVSLCWASFGVVATTAMMTGPQSVWMLARFATGIASGIVFVLTISLVLDRSTRIGSSNGLAWVFSGVGLGIAAVGIAVPAFASVTGSAGTWAGVAACACVIFGFALPSIHEEPVVVVPARPSLQDSAARDAGAFRWLALIYGIEGATYIIPATFLVAMVNEAPGLTRYGGLVWVVVGLVAAPTAAVWGSLGRRFGKRNALVTAMGLQAVGLAVPAFVGGLAGVLAVALTLGATFLGVTALTSALTRELRPANTNLAIGVLTIVYGIGQIVGPLIAVRVWQATGSYRGSLFVASALAAVAAIAFGARMAALPKTGRLTPPTGAPG